MRFILFNNNNNKVSLIITLTGSILSIIIITKITVSNHLFDNDKAILFVIAWTEGL